MPLRQIIQQSKNQNFNRSSSQQRTQQINYSSSGQSDAQILQQQDNNSQIDSRKIIDKKQLEVFNTTRFYYKQKIGRDLFESRGIKRHFRHKNQFYFQIKWNNKVQNRHYKNYVFSYRYLKEKNPKKLLEYLEPYLNK